MLLNTSDFNNSQNNATENNATENNATQNEINEIRKKTFRFKFNEDTQEKLAYFADIHKLDDRKTFKEEWKTWIEDNSSMLKSETEYLQNMGYDGNVEDKMFKSARYYFKNKKPKSVDEQEPKQRRKYIKMNKTILMLIDQHITENINKNNYKPSEGFQWFKEKFQNEVSQEFNRIKENSDISEEDVEEKMKKTYKNRYFNKINKN